MFLQIFNSYKSSFGGLPREIWYLSLVTLINRAGTMVLAFLVLYLTEDKGLTTVQAGFIYGLYGLGAIGGNFLGGWLSDRTGPLITQVISLVLGGSGFIFLSQLESPTAIAITLVPLGIVSEAFRPANSTAVAFFSPPELRTRSFGLLRMALNLGMGIGPVVGGFLAEHSYQLLFFVDGVTCILAGMTLWALFATQVKMSNTKEEEAEDSLPRKSPWTDGIYLQFVFLFALLIIVFSQLNSTVPLYFRDTYKFSKSTIGLILGLNPIVIVLLEMPLLAFIQRFQAQKILAWGALLICIGFGLLPFGSGTTFVILTVLVWTLGEMLNFPLGMSICSQHAPDRSRGSYMGLLSMSLSAAHAASPLLGTWISEKFSPDTLWYVIGIVGFILFVAFWTFPKKIFRQS